MPLKLVVIDSKTFQHSAYEGKNRVRSATLSRVMENDEVEAFRVKPNEFLDGVEEVDGNVA